MSFGGVVILYSVYTLGLPSEISNLQNELSSFLDKPSTQLYVDIEQPDTTEVKELLSEAAFPVLSNKPPSTAYKNSKKSKPDRTIKRSLNLASLEGKTTKSQYRSEKELSRVINKHNSAIEYCYKKEAKKNPSLKGDLEVEFTIDYNGRVTSVNIVKSSMFSRAIEKCISNRIKGWRFKPIAKDDGDVKVRQKYIFG
jgi:TonB family protein